jgi:lipoate-protein ligase A
VSGAWAWAVERPRGTAAAHHARDVLEGAARTVWAFALDGPALVLGSTQAETDVDRSAAERLGVDVVRRRSGGGAVLLEPGDVAWVDVVVPRGDPLWHDDVAVAAEWLGEAWAAALGDLGVVGGEVHRGGLACGRLGSVVCFDGTGPGEVAVGGEKVVGISQRRTRAGARFQCSVPLAWRPERHAALLAPGIARALAGADPLEAANAVAVRPLIGVGVDEVLGALLDRLPGGG